MEILGIGPLELLFFIIILLIVLGPDDMQKAGKTVGKSMRKIVTSPTWLVLVEFSRGLRNVPTLLMRATDIEEEYKTIQNDLQEVRAFRKELGELNLNATPEEKRAAMRQSLQQQVLPQTTRTSQAAPAPQSGPLEGLDIWRSGGAAPQQPANLAGLDAWRGGGTLPAPEQPPTSDPD
jgi:hypothetical protein